MVRGSTPVFSGSLSRLLRGRRSRRGSRSPLQGLEGRFRLPSQPLWSFSGSVCHTEECQCSSGQFDHQYRSSCHPYLPSRLWDFCWDSPARQEALTYATLMNSMKGQFEHIQADMMRHFAESKYFCITADSWDERKKSFWGMTAHFQVCIHTWW